MKRKPIWDSVHSGIYAKRLASKKSIREAKKIIDTYQLSGYDIALILRSFVEISHRKEKVQAAVEIGICGLLIANLIAIGILLVK